MKKCRMCIYWAHIELDIGRCIRAMSRNYDNQTKENDFCDYFKTTLADIMKENEKMAGETKIQDSSKIDETRLIFKSWTCSFCGGTYADRDLAIKHALDCDENEDVHSCATCALYEVGEDSRDGYRHICKGNKNRIDTWMKHCPEWIGG